MRRTTQTKQISLFDSILSGQAQKEEEEKQMKYSVKNQNEQGIQNTKSLHHLNDIFYSNIIDYKDFKQSLRYNNKNLKKIALENIKNPHPKIIKNLNKFDLSGLIELKLINIDISDSKFEMFLKKGGLSTCFKKLTILTLNCQSMTSNSLEYLFQGNQIIQYLDLGHTKIDNQGINYLSKLQWPFLETFIIQWCNKINNLNEIGLNAENFPNLKILDSRFIQANNEAYSKIINSSLSITLNNIRLFGTDVDLENIPWKQSFLLNLFLEKIRGQNTQEFIIQNNPTCDRTTNNYKQMRVMTSKDLQGQRFNDVNKSFLEDRSFYCVITIYRNSRKQRLKIQQFWQTVQLFVQRMVQLKKIYQLQLRKSLNKMILNFDKIQCDESNLDILLKTIVDFKEMKKLQLNIQNQMLLKPVSYYFVFNQISELQKLIKLQVFFITVYIINIYMNLIILIVLQNQQNNIIVTVSISARFLKQQISDK